jgi:sulfate permease, SulP family
MGYLFTQTLSGPDALSLRALAQDAEGYDIKKAWSDISAALSVALLSVPQALAYSIVVGVPPIAGVISMVLGTAIASLLASSSHLIIGPNNATCLLVQAAIMEIFQKFYAGSEGVSRAFISIELLTTMTLFIGLTQLIAAFFKLGRLIQFVSHAVVVGYIAGTALAIIISQLFPLTGISCPDHIDSLYQKLSYWFSHLHDAQLMTLGIGLSSLIIIFLMRRLQWKFPVSLAMLVVVTGAVALFGLYEFPDDSGRTLQLIGCQDVSCLCFSFRPPLIELRLLNSLLPIAFAIALIGMLEAHSIAKSIAAATGQRLTSNQDVFALGCSNFFLSFFGGIPCSGSATRSNLNVECGAKTRFAGFYSSIFVVLLTLCLGPVMAFVPKASLAALLIATALRIVDMAQVRLCWRATRSDGLVLIVTFLSCVFFSLPLAFYMGVALSIILYLRKASTPRVIEYIYEESTGSICQAHEEDKRLPHAIRMINVEGELFFGAMDLFQHTLRAITEDDASTKVFILRLKHVHDLDATTALALRQLKDYLSRGGRHLIICSIPPHVLELLENVQLIDHLGRDNVILFDRQAPHTWLERALRRARYLLRHGEELAAESEEKTGLTPVSAMAVE